MDKHSPEPWKYEPYSGPAPNFHAAVVTCKDSSSFVAAVAGETKEESLANIRRIVACVNACRGVETEFLEALPHGAVESLLYDGEE